MNNRLEQFTTINLFTYCAIYAQFSAMSVSLGGAPFTNMD